MAIWDLCIRRPIFTVMLITAPMVLGLASYFRLGVDTFPNVDLVVVVVTTTTRGASTEEMESSVTRPIEEAVNGVSGIDELRSITREGVSQVIIGFVLEKNGDVAAQEVRDKIAAIQNQLPTGTDPPIVERFNLDATPVLQFAVFGKRSLQEITEITRKQLKENLESVYGVGTVTIVGGRPRAIQVKVDPDSMAGLALSIEDVRLALIRQNIELPTGRVTQATQEQTLRLIGRVERVEEFLDIIIETRNGFPIRLRDIGTVEDTTEEPRGLSRLDDKNAVSVSIQKKSGTNTVEVAEAIKARLDVLRTTLPKDIDFFIVRDQSRFIKESIAEVKFHLLLAAVLVALTILLFIRDWRTTVIAAVSIPTSLIATFAFMHYMGYTLNNLTLLGLVLAVGIVIDDAVVVHENIFRHMEEYGLDAAEASSSATREIGLAVAATTLSLLVIFIPVAFMSGRVGRFFNSFGATVAFAILMSMIVSFTLTPMLCSRFLKLDKSHGKSTKDGPIWKAVNRGYLGILNWSLRRRWVIVLLTAGLFLSTPVLAMIVSKDFVTRDDQGEFEVDVLLPEGTNLAAADAIAAELSGRFAKMRGVEHVFTRIGDLTNRVGKGQGEVTRVNFYIRMIDLRRRQFSQFDVMFDARAILRDYPDLRSIVQIIKPYDTQGAREVQIDLNLRGPDLQKLQELSEELMKWMRTRGTYVDVDSTLSLRNPERRIRIDREKAADLGIPVEQVARAMNILVGGEIVTKFKEGAEQYDVWLRAAPSNRGSEKQIESLWLPSKVGPVQLSNLARLEPAVGPGGIDRFNRARQVSVQCNLLGIGTSDAVEDLTTKLKSMNLPPGYSFEFLGEAKLLAESNENFLLAFVLAFVFMYMILAAQFESFVHPITILLAVPLTLPFALISLILLRSSLDLYAMLGLFMLFGIVKKNGILQVDYTNVLRTRGKPTREAILEANETRLRPILMTTFMLVAAMVPIALGEGPGASARASMAKVILGGQLLSLLLSLLVTPVAYSIWDDLGNRFARRRHREIRSVVPTTEPVSTKSLVPIRSRAENVVSSS